MYVAYLKGTILCLTSRTTRTSARIPEEDACQRSRYLCVFSRVGTPGLMHKKCVLQRVSLGAFSDVTVILGMRQSIELNNVKLMLDHIQVLCVEKTLYRV